jgi:hypothetical protein
MKTLNFYRHDEWNMDCSGETQRDAAKSIGAEVNELRFVKSMTEQEIELERVPEDFRSVLSFMAYQRGHSAGDDEVLVVLQGLINDLEPAIKSYTERLRAAEYPPLPPSAAPKSSGLRA